MAYKMTLRVLQSLQWENTEKDHRETATYGKADLVRG